MTIGNGDLPPPPPGGRFLVEQLGQLVEQGAAELFGIDQGDGSVLVLIDRIG